MERPPPLRAWCQIRFKQTESLFFSFPVTGSRFDFFGSSSLNDIDLYDCGVGRQAGDVAVRDEAPGVHCQDRTEDQEPSRHRGEGR